MDAHDRTMLRLFSGVGWGVLAAMTTAAIGRSAWASLPLTAGMLVLANLLPLALRSGRTKSFLLGQLLVVALGGAFLAFAFFAALNSQAARYCQFGRC
jgi:hypothetical protein